MGSGRKAFRRKIPRASSLASQAPRNTNSPVLPAHAFVLQSEKDARPPWISAATPFKADGLRALRLPLARPISVPIRPTPLAPDHGARPWRTGLMATLAPPSRARPSQSDGARFLSFRRLQPFRGSAHAQRISAPYLAGALLFPTEPATPFGKASLFVIRQIFLFFRHKRAP